MWEAWLWSKVYSLVSVVEKPEAIFLMIPENLSGGYSSKGWGSFVVVVIVLKNKTKQ